MAVIIPFHIPIRFHKGDFHKGKKIRPVPCGRVIEFSPRPTKDNLPEFLKKLAARS